jgi:hypothetical protein
MDNLKKAGNQTDGQLTNTLLKPLSLLARICNPCKTLKMWKVYVLFSPVGGLNYNCRLQSYLLTKGFTIF